MSKSAFLYLVMLSVGSFSPVWAGNFSIPEEDIARLSNLYRSAKSVINEADVLRQNLDTQQIQIDSLTASIDSFEKEKFSNTIQPLITIASNNGFLYMKNE